MKNHHSSHSNKIAYPLRNKAIVVCAFLSLLTACGQRGSLYIPTAPEAAQRSTIVDTLTNKPAVSPPSTNTTQPANSTNSAPAK